MKQLFALCGLAFWLLSCANNTGNTAGAASEADTTKNITTNVGGAGTGGVGAGYGTGGSTVVTPITGAENDSMRHDSMRK